MSVSKVVSAGLLLCAAIHPGSAEAQFGLGRRPLRMFNTCCAPMHARAWAPMHNPCCAPVHTPIAPCCDQPIMAPAPCGVCATPVPRTTLVPRQVVTCQTVPQVQYQRQAYTVNVPVTSYQNVTVDEGSYQTVWVPRPVQRQVAQTMMQPQVQYRDVAVQTQQQIAQVQTQYVPQLSYGYLPGMQVGGLPMTGLPMTGLPMTGVPMMGGPVYGGYPVYGAIAPIPMSAGLPGAVTPGVPVPDPVGVNPAGLHQQPTPYRQGAGEDWSPIRQREGSGPVSGITPVPSAATVWQSQLQTGAVAR